MLQGSRTQRVTKKDIAGGRIRVPRATKPIFPAERSRMTVELLGTSLECSWDPRFGPDQERSGVIRVGRNVLSGLVEPDEVLLVYPTANGVAIRREIDRAATDGPVRELSNMRQAAARFAEERDWGQFHTPKDLALGLTLEAAELAELMQWKNGEELREHLAANREALEDELADVLWYTLLLAHYQDIDLAAAFERKLAKNAEKYPVAKSRGSARKYTELDHE